MNKTQMRFEYLKTLIMSREISDLLDVPILIALWYLNYHTAFWWVLGLIILSGISSSNRIVNLERELGLRK